MHKNSPIFIWGDVGELTSIEKHANDFFFFFLRNKNMSMIEWKMMNSSYFYLY